MFGWQTASADRGLHYSEAFWSRSRTSHTPVTEKEVAEKLLSAGTWLSQAASDQQLPSMILAVSSEDGGVCHVMNRVVYSGAVT